MKVNQNAAPTHAAAQRQRYRRRAASVIMAALVGLGSLAACATSSSSADGSEGSGQTGAVVTRDLQQVTVLDGILTLDDQRSVHYLVEGPEPDQVDNGAGGASGQAAGGQSGGVPSSGGAGGAGGGTGGGAGAVPTTIPRPPPSTSTPSTTTTTTSTTTTPTTTTTTSTTTTTIAAPAVALTSAVADTPALLASTRSLSQAAPTGSGESASTGTVTSIITPDAEVVRGTELYSVDQQPTVALIGSEPAWRSLEVGIEAGPDVLQLELNLEALGYGESMTVDDEFTSATASAVSSWQADRDEEATGRIELGTVVFLPETTQVGGTVVAIGDLVASGTEMLTVTSTTPVVAVAVAASEATAILVGVPVSVTLANGSTVDGLVASIGRVATFIEGEAVADSTIDVVIALADPAAAVQEGAASVGFVIDEVVAVLAVPAGAVATVDGSSTILVIDEQAGPDGRLVEVKLGLAADGFVQVSTDEMMAGDVVSLNRTASG